MVLITFILFSVDPVHKKINLKKKATLEAEGYKESNMVECSSLIRMSLNYLFFLLLQNAALCRSAMNPWRGESLVFPLFPVLKPSDNTANSKILNLFLVLSTVLQLFGISQSFSPGWDSTLRKDKLE